MELSTFILILLSLGFAFMFSFLYWQMRGQRDLRSTVKELKIETTEVLEDIYRSSLDRVHDLEDQVELAEQSVANKFKGRLRNAGSALERIKTAINQAAAKVGSETFLKIRKSQADLAERLRQLRARIRLIQLKSNIKRAEDLAHESQFEEAEELIEQALGQLRDIKDDLSRSRSYDRTILDVQIALRRALRSLRANLRNVDDRMKKVGLESEHLLAQLEKTEKNKQDLNRDAS